MIYEYIVYPLFIISIIFSIYAQYKISSTYSRYSSYMTRSGMNASDFARMMLSTNGVYDVSIGRVRGNLTDHFDPRSNTLALSDTTFNSHSAAAIGVAAHEAGHAIQHAEAYGPMELRRAIVPVTSFASGLSVPLFFIGLLFELSPIVYAGIILFALTTVFELVTLPVELDASKRAMAILRGNAYLDDDELKGVKSVLTAAAMTYLASLLVSLASLLRLVLLAGGRSRRD